MGNTFTYNTQIFIITIIVFTIFDCKELVKDTRLNMTSDWLGNTSTPSPSQLTDGGDRTDTTRFGPEWVQ